MCFIFILASSFVISGVFLQCQTCCCTLYISCCVSWGGDRNRVENVLFSCRRIPMKRSGEELLEKGLSLRMICYHCAVSVCEDSSSAFPAHQHSFTVDIHRAVLLSLSNRENQKGENKKDDSVSPAGFITGVSVFLQGSEVLSQDGTLSIDQATFEKAGEYVCVGAVSAVPGLTAQASVNLTVKGNTLPGLIHRICNPSQEIANVQDTFILVFLAHFSKNGEGTVLIKHLSV